MHKQRKDWTPGIIYSRLPGVEQEFSFSKLNFNTLRKVGFIWEIFEYAIFSLCKYSYACKNGYTAIIIMDRQCCFCCQITSHSVKWIKFKGPNEFLIGIGESLLIGSVITLWYFTLFNRIWEQWDDDNIFKDDIHYFYSTTR